MGVVGGRLLDRALAYAGKLAHLQRHPAPAAMRPCTSPHQKIERVVGKQGPRIQSTPRVLRAHHRSLLFEVRFPRCSRAKRQPLEQSIAGQPHCHWSSLVVTVSKSISHEPGERLSSNRWAASFFGLSLRAASTSSRASSYRLSCMVARAAYARRGRAPKPSRIESSRVESSRVASSRVDRS